ncbi:hypothetical protein H310_06599 [Aphanomyces invadans]|uniref:RING-type domain-containing protein n=1 Tax=Aphanomyces invadans TaxID=157072 RepID=A0A024U3H8_9STRA|nr:hypothetical protein H310_06599 [Aphanomyces invadans]ETW00951.1 hypothetical protein H310_06599 [Aphanomyces invadans]|eukprot:XP_008869949.1 hypothetical protein H310_06599 [Aphanomyces invadans]
MDPRHAWFVRLKEALDDSLKHVTLTVQPSRACLRGRNPFTVYHYTISKPGFRWAVDRRYSECHHLRKDLLRHFRRTSQSTLASFLAPIAHVDFPKKRFGEDTKGVVGERQLKLKKFLRVCMEVRATLMAYVVVYQHRSASVLIVILDHLDMFLGVPPQLCDAERRLIQGFLSLLQHHETHAPLPIPSLDAKATRPSSLDDCAICLGDFDDNDAHVVTLPCNHMFHSDCVFPWLVRDHSCPLCRTSAVDYP